MKTLYLLRHAKSSWADPDQRDFDRPLNARGQDAADLMGRWCRDYRLEPAKVMVSSAVRTRETVARLAAAWGRDLAPEFHETLYLASADDLLSVVQGLPDALPSAMLIGHNPGLEDLAMLLARRGEGKTHKTLLEKYPTGTLAQIRLDVDRWADVEAKAGWLEAFVRPRQLDPSHDDD
jgi:phosphohistidine phosphatase